MKTLENEWYIAIKAYKLVIFEILRVFFFVLPYIVCLCYPYIRVYRLYDTDSTITSIYVLPIPNV